MNDRIQYAFLDESGTVGFPGGTHFLVVALLSTEKPRNIELRIKKVLKKYGRSTKRSEIKAANFEKKAIIRLLNVISQEDISIFATIVDQSVISNPPEEMEEIYRQAVSQTVYRIVERCPRVTVCLDQRYTNKRHRFELEAQIREAIQDLPQKVVLVEQENSIKRKELQAVDSVAWALFQKYERGDDSYYDIFSSKMMTEEIIRKKDWK